VLLLGEMSGFTLEDNLVFVTVTITIARNKFSVESSSKLFKLISETSFCAIHILAVSKIFCIYFIIIKDLKS